ncbi:hypothetical protein NPIL_527411, partial [Nephila pilipes]
PITVTYTHMWAANGSIAATQQTDNRKNSARFFHLLELQFPTLVLDSSDRWRSISWQLLSLITT